MIDTSTWRLATDLIAYCDLESERVVLVEKTKKKPAGLSKRKEVEIPEDTKFNIRFSSDVMAFGKPTIEVNCKELPGWFKIEGIFPIAIDYILKNAHIDKGRVQEKMVVITKGLSGFSFILEDDPNYDDYASRRTIEYGTIISSKTKTRVSGHQYYNPSNELSFIFINRFDGGRYKNLVVGKKLSGEVNISDVFKRPDDLMLIDDSSTLVDCGEVLKDDTQSLSEDDILEKLILESKSLGNIISFQNLLSYDPLKITNAQTEKIKNHIIELVKNSYTDWMISTRKSISSDLNVFFREYLDLSSTVQSQLLRYDLDKAINFNDLFAKFNVDAYLSDWDNFINNYKKVRIWKKNTGTFYVNRGRNTNSKISNTFKGSIELGNLLLKITKHGLDTFGNKISEFFRIGTNTVLVVNLEDVLSWVDNKPSPELMADIINFQFTELEVILGENIDIE